MLEDLEDARDRRRRADRRRASFCSSDVRAARGRACRSRAYTRGQRRRRRRRVSIEQSREAAAGRTRARARPSTSSPNARMMSIATASSSASAVTSGSPTMSTFSWKCSRSRPLLLALVAEQLRHREPAHRLAQRVRLRGDHARERRRHLRAQRHLAAALVGEVVELADDLVAALPRVQLERLERRPVVLDERIAPRDVAPGPDDVSSRSASSDG